MLELQYELESKAARWYATTDIPNAFFFIPLATECRPQFAFTWRGVQYTWNRLPQGWKHSLTICHALIQAALEKGEAPEHLQYIDDIIVCGNTAAEVFEREDHPDSPGSWFCHQEEQGQGTCLRDPVLGSSGKMDSIRFPLSYRGSEANYTPTEKEILAAYEGVQATSEVTGTEAQLLLAPRLPVLGWMFKRKAPSTHHTTDATWCKWTALTAQRAHIGNPNRPGILEIITNRPEGENFRLTDEEEQEEVTRAEEAPLYNQLPAEETSYALFTDGSCHIIEMN
ncbi:hypothetical protein HGM15179_019852 [Zosterops borbonicus]|uniref:ribonuclease H n=1 Tax=Zosterops borbonicus TaxID=364589 RepID=A0A8K1D9U4_9PASS|nr:hypothetical protein HGM15179_019852 [Zosterops borbonicus]